MTAPESAPTRWTLRADARRALAAYRLAMRSAWTAYPLRSRVSLTKLVAVRAELRNALAALASAQAALEQLGPLEAELPRENRFAP